jgi:hypothetical protein
MHPLLGHPVSENFVSGCQTLKNSSASLLCIQETYFISTISQNGERLEREKCMPCVVARIYIVGSLVVLERGVRVRRNCNIFNLAMENVFKRLT